MDKNKTKIKCYRTIRLQRDVGWKRMKYLVKTLEQFLRGFLRIYLKRKLGNQNENGQQPREE